MNIDASSFVRRARFFLAELRRDAFPNATSLQRFDSCSRSTAARTIERLQAEFGFPIAFDPSQRGYYLTDPGFTFQFLPPGKDEYSALFLLRQLSDSIGSQDVSRAVDSLWNSAVSNSSVVRHDLSAMERHFSADLTAVSVIADTGVLALVQFATTGTTVRVAYKSPWRHPEPREYLGLVEHVHLSDGAVYVLFRSDNGRRLILNASFIKKIDAVPDPIEMAPPSQSDVDLAWRDGFGVWASEDLHRVEIRISAPAAEYYAQQRWHIDQEDSWDGAVLVRTFPSMLSPELVRRILSLGRFVVAIEPQELQRLVLEEADGLRLNLNKPTT